MIPAQANGSRANAHPLSGARVLITGGAGFIGSHLADELISHGYRVTLFDCLDNQVHGPRRSPPPYLNQRADLEIGDLLDYQRVREVVRQADCVYHLAACVGVGQSMYEIARYTQVNSLGTAHLLQAITEHPVRKLVVASSMSVYGEGLYQDTHGHPVHPSERLPAQMAEGQWEPLGKDRRPLAPVPTPETTTCAPSSIYALGKYEQEQMCLIFGRAYQIPTVALRFFNTYGPRQALSNPYTGVLAIFASRLLNGQPPKIFEDGHQRRDFVHVRDVARACRLALESARAVDQAINVGSGEARSIREVADVLGRTMGRPEIEPAVTGNYRLGDIRHCYADISLARRNLGYAPRVEFQDGVAELAAWLEGQEAYDHVESATAELARRGLVR